MRNDFAVGVPLVRGDEGRRGRKTFFLESKTAQRSSLLVEASLVAEDGSDLGVVGVDSGQHLGVVVLEVLPEVIGHEGVGDLGRVEAVDGLDELPELTSVVGPLVDDGSERVVNVEGIEVVELLGTGNLGKDSVELALANGGHVAHGGVGVHPSPAGRGLEAVEVVVELSISDVVTGGSNGVDAVGESLVQDATISETSHEEVRSLGDVVGVQVAKSLHRVLVHLLGGGHAGKVVVAVANIVTDESQVDEQGVVEVVVAGEGLDDSSGHRRRAGTVDSNVLEIAHRALVALDVLEVEGGDLGTGITDPFGLMISRRGGHVGPVQLVLQDLQQVTEGVSRNEVGVDPLRGDGEVSSGRISQNGDSVGLRASAQVLLVRVASRGVGSLDAVAVVIDIEGVSRVNRGTSRMDGGIPIVTVLSTPSIAAEFEQGAVSITVEVDKRAMVGYGQDDVLMSDLLRGESARVLLGLGLLLDALLLSLEGVSREQVALGVRAELDLLADAIRGLLILEHGDNGGTEDGDDLLAPRLRSLYQSKDNSSKRIKRRGSGRHSG